MDARESALSPQERQLLVQDIARDVMGLGPIEQFLKDASVSEVMVNGSDNIYVERSGLRRTDQRPVHLRGASASGDRADRVVGGPTHRRVVTDGRRPLRRRLPRQRHRPAAVAGRLDPDDPQVRQGSVHGRRPDRHGHVHRRRCDSAGRHGGGRHEHPRLRRYRHRQDHAAQRVVGLHSARPSGSSPSKTPSNCSCTRNTWSAWRPARPTPKATARSPSAIWSATPCACDPTASSSARSRR